MSSSEQRSERWTIHVCVDCRETTDMCGCEPDFDGKEPKVDEIEVVPADSAVYRGQHVPPPADA